MIRFLSQALHLLMDVAIGVLGLLALAACLLAWRLAQGPIDVTALVVREQPLFIPSDVKFSIGSAALAWEGFSARDQPLDIRVLDLRLSVPGGKARVKQARVALAIGQLLLGRPVPRVMIIDGAVVQVERLKVGFWDRQRGSGEGRHGAHPTGQAMLQEFSQPARAGDNLPWLSQVRKLQVTESSLSIEDAPPGMAWQASHIDVDLKRPGTFGVTGQARLDLEAADLHATITAQADGRADGTHLLASITPVSPASLARLVPPLAALAGVNAPVSAQLDASFGPGLAPLSARVKMSAGAGTVKAGKGQIALQGAEAMLEMLPNSLKLVSARLALASPSGRKPAPVITGSAKANMLAGQVNASFALSVDSLDFADLGTYWPPSIAAGSRDWLVENIVGGHVHGAHAEGALQTQADFSNVKLTSLSGGFSADDLTAFWLKPIPPLLHGRAKLTLQGPDAIHIAIDGADQGALRLLPGSSMDITNLEEKHQFGDIEARLAGPLDTALGLLNHPRLKLLARSGLDFTGAAGSARATLKIHLPLEDTVTMDDIRIGATAALTDVHLGKIAAGRDLDDAALDLSVDNDGLNLTGHGDFSAIPTDLALKMDFRDGPPSQVLQHVTAHGLAASSDLAKAGLPQNVTQNFAGGTIGLGADYTALRDHTATLLLNANLGDAALKTPLGWTKAAGPPAEASARLSWDHGQLVQIDRLHAQGPGLLIASHAAMEGAHARALILDTLQFGRTSAHGKIGFPSKADGWNVSLSGDMLDLSTYLDEPRTARPKTVPEAEKDLPDAAEKRGTPWRAKLDFSQVGLAKGKILASLQASAEDDGLHITAANITAGPPGKLMARIVPEGDRRRLTVSSSDAGVFLLGMGVADNIEGGSLHIEGVFADALPGDPLTGIATLTHFSVRDAPAIGRLMQAMTLYGLFDALRDKGLHFSRMVAPYRWQKRVLHLSNARAFSPSLGLTAQGDIDLRRRVADIHGTVVPAYFFNQLLGDLPVVGKLFSPEKGGGLFAARYSVTGPLADPKVGINPLSALTPGFLRDVFGLLPK